MKKIKRAVKDFLNSRQHYKVLWHKVSIRDYQALDKVINDKTLTNLDRTIKTLSIIEGKPEQHYLGIPLTELKWLKKTLTWQPVETLNTKLPKVFWFKGQLYKVCYRIDKMTYGQQNEILDLTATIDDVNRLMAVVCTPVFGRTRSRKDVDKRAELFLDLKLDIVWPVSQYYFKLWGALLQGIDSSIKQSLIELVNDAGEALEPEMFADMYKKLSDETPASEVNAMLKEQLDNLTALIKEMKKEQGNG